MRLFRSGSVRIGYVPLRSSYGNSPMPYPRKQFPGMFGQMFIEDAADSEGWSEGYYFPSADYNQGINTLRQLRDLRAALLTQEMIVRYLRVSRLALRGDTLIDDTQTQGTYLVTSGPQRSVASNVCWVMRIDCQSPSVRHAQRQMHGVPRDCLVNLLDRGFNPPTQWTTPYVAFAAFYKAQCVEVFKVDNASPPNYDTFTPLTVGFRSLLQDRKIGRPFGLQRGRRAIV